MSTAAARALLTAVSAARLRKELGLREATAVIHNVSSSEHQLSNISGEGKPAGTDYVTNRSSYVLKERENTGGRGGGGSQGFGTGSSHHALQLDQYKTYKNRL